MFGRSGPSAAGRSIEAVVDMIVDQCLLSLANRPLDGMKLLGQVETGAAIREHLDHLVKMTFRALEASDDPGVCSVNMIFHSAIVSPQGGYAKDCLE